MKHHFIKTIIVLGFAFQLFGSWASAQSVPQGSTPSSGSGTNTQQNINEVIQQYMEDHESEALNQVLATVTSPKQKTCLKKTMECSINTGENKTKCANLYNSCMAKK